MAEAVSEPAVGGNPFFCFSALFFFNPKVLFLLFALCSSSVIRRAVYVGERGLRRNGRWLERSAFQECYPGGYSKRWRVLVVKFDTDGF